jgi:hypothetical protein
VSGRRSRTHHYVPKGIQKNFCFEGKRIWYSEKDPTGKYSTPEVRNIDTTFQKKDYYTVREKGKPSDIVEKNFYSKLDDFLAKLLDSVHASFEQGIVPTFDREGERTVARALFYCVKRNPDFSSTFDDQQIGLEVTEKLIDAVSEWDNSQDVINSLKKQRESRLDLRSIGRDVRVRAQLRSSDQVESELDTLNVRWVVSEGPHSFLLCSSLIYRIGNGGPNGLSNPDFEMWLPISPKRALVLMRARSNDIPLVVKIDRNHMRKMNLFGLDESHCIASHDQKLMQSLISNR